MSTYSSNLYIELIGTGEQTGTWGSTTNNNFQYVFEEAIVGRATVAFSDADVTLTPVAATTNQTFRNVYLNCTGTNTASRNLVVPTINKNYIVENNTTGGFNIVVKTAAGTGITVPNGFKCAVYVDGTNVVSAFNYLGSALTLSSLTVTGASTLTGVTTHGNNVIFASDNAYDIGASGATRPRDLYLGRNLSVGGTQDWYGNATFANNANIGETPKYIKSDAFGAAIRFAANGAVATDRDLQLGFVNNSAVFAKVVSIGDTYAQFFGGLLPGSDNTIDIGQSGNRFRTFYMAGSQYIAGNIYQNASTASSWDGNWSAIQNSSGSFAGLTSGQDMRIFMNGAVIGGAEKYVANGFATVQRVTANGINWATYASGTAGNSFGTPTGQLFFTQSGRLGVGFSVTQTPNTEISTLGGSFSVNSTTTSGSTNVGNLRSYSDYSGSNFELTRMEMNTKGAADDGEYNFYTRYGGSLFSRLRLGRDGVIGGLFGANGVSVAAYPFDGQNGTATGSDVTGWVFNGAMGSGGGSYYGNGAGIQLSSTTNNNTKIMGGVSAHLVGGGTGGAATNESGGLAFWVKNAGSTAITKAMYLLNGSLLGLNTVPSSWSYPAMDIGAYPSLSGDSAGYMQLTANLYNDGSWRGKSSNYATLYQQYVGDGLHSWWSTTTQTSNGAVASTLTRNMLLTRTGILQVGYTGGSVSGNSSLEVVSSGTNAQLEVRNSASTFSMQSNSQDGYLNVTGTGSLYFRFGSGANVKATLNSAGALTLGSSIYPSANTTISLSTVGWSANTWYTVAAPGTFSNGNTFWVVYRWDHDGGGGPYIMSGAFMWTVVNTNGGGVDNTFSPLGSSHTGGGNYFSFRTRAGSASTSGLEVQATAINSGTLIVRFFNFHNFV